MSWEPKILATLCNWCSYQGADLAGTSRMKYPHNIRIVRVMCSGRVEPLSVLWALRNGADGVLIAGCHPGDCHYSEGNLKTQRRIPLLKEMLAQLGVEPERVQLAWVSAAEANEFVKITTEMTERIRKLGPLRMREEVLSPGARAEAAKIEKVAA